MVTAELTTERRRDVTAQAAYDVRTPLVLRFQPAGWSGDSRLRNRCQRALHERATERPAWPSWLEESELCLARSPAAGSIDDLVFAKLKAMRINPSGICDDSAFLRRAFLDADRPASRAGRARSFLDDRDPASGPNWLTAWLNGPSSQISGLSSGPMCSAMKKRRWERRERGFFSAGSGTKSRATPRLI